MNNNWDNYRKWEQLPEHIFAPQPSNGLARLLKKVQSSLANTLVRELSFARQLKHLERCSKFDLTQPSKQTKISEFTLVEPLTTAKRSLIDLLYGK